MLGDTIYSISIHLCNLATLIVTVSQALSGTKLHHRVYFPRQRMLRTFHIEIGAGATTIVNLPEMIKRFEFQNTSTVRTIIIYDMDSLLLTTAIKAVIGVLPGVSIYTWKSSKK